MSFFDKQVTTVKIDAENSVVIRKLTYGEGKDIMSLSVVTNPLTGDMEMDLGKFQMERMVRALVSWEGPGFEKKKVTRANVAALPLWIGKLLDAAYDDLDPDVSSEEGNE